MILSPKSKTVEAMEFGLIAPDKSLSHRSLIFSFLTQGESEIENLLNSKDIQATLKIAQNLGARIRTKGNTTWITPPVAIPKQVRLQCLNSGTTMRLFAGLLSGIDGRFAFDGDESLRKRPMERIRNPLEKMGARLSSSFAPFVLEGCSLLSGISYHSPIASAQVKGAFILASLNAKDKSFYFEDELSRDHTERFLSYLGAEISYQNKGLVIAPLSTSLPAYHIQIPNDPSSIIFLVVACLIAQNMSIKVSQVLLNPSRIYAFEVLKSMGGKIEYEVLDEGLEKIGNLYVQSSDLFGVEVDKHIASLIDEIPALCIAFACANGVSRIKNAQELRVKESDRIAVMVKNLRILGIEVVEYEDGLEISGGEFKQGCVQSYGDHRIAMSFALAGIKTKVEVLGSECVGVSFPNFFEIFKFFVNIEE